MKNLLSKSLLALAVIGAALMGFLAGRQSPDAPPSGHETQLTSLLSTSFYDLSGKSQQLNQFRGKFVVVNYWATWCPPCRKELPGFVRLAEKYREKNVQFVGISLDEVGKVAAFREKFQINYPLWLASEAAIADTRALGNESQSLPFTVVLDDRQQLIFSHLGLWAEQDLDEKLQELTAGHLH